MLYNFLDDPAGMDHHVHRSVLWATKHQLSPTHAKTPSYATAIVMEIAYGHRVLSNDDEYLKVAERIFNVLHDANRPSLLDVSPIC